MKPFLAAATALLLLLAAAGGAGGRHIAQEAGGLPSGAAVELLGGTAVAAERSPDGLDRGRKQEMEPQGDQGTPADDKRAEGEGDKTIAQFLDEKLKEEFKGEEEKKGGAGRQFNETVASSEGNQETVVIISSKKKSNATTAAAAAAAAGDAAATAAAGGTSPGATLPGGGGAAAAGDTDAGGLAGDVTVAAAHAAYESATAAAAGEGAESAERQRGKEEQKKELEEKLEAAAEADVDRIIDSKDNEYVLSKPSDTDSMGINLDPQFVRDLTVLIAASAAAGVVMGLLGQPAINGYFVAGSLVGPGGFKLIKEIVQVQSVAQLGVHLLLFTLGLEFSLTKLRAVRNVALLGGLLQTALFAALAGVGAKLIGTAAAQGAFVGALVSMGSTTIVIKVLADCRTTNTQPGQITIGTLVLQDCLVGLLFAFMPVLATAAGGSADFDIALLLTVMGRVAAKLAVLGVGALVVARTVLPPTWRWLARRFGPESFQLASIAFCLLCALATARQGVSAELGAFAAGVMLSATEQQEAVLHHLEPVAQLFLALFVSSTGLVLSPVFLVNHLPLLATGAVLVVVAKTVLITCVVKAFRYPLDTALAVGINLSQIGEFVFVLLSVASQQELLDQHVYLLLMGVTALTLLMTPFLLQISNKLIPRARGPPNGPSAGDLEMSGGGPPPPKRRPSANGTEPLTAKQSPSPESTPGRGGAPLAAAAASLSPGSATAQLLSNSLELGMAHTLPQGARTKLEHRGSIHRAAQLASHGSNPGLEISLSPAGVPPVSAGATIITPRPPSATPR